MKTIETATLEHWVKTGLKFVLVDTLPRQTFDEGHLPGAINIVSDEILTRASVEIPDRHVTVVVYCASAACQRAGLSAERLKSLGYTDIHHYLAGKRGWVTSGHALERA